MENWKITVEAKLLYEALRLRGVNAILEYFDGHKHVDIGIPDAYIYIEIDGDNHITDPKQIETDFTRDHYSEVEGFKTLRISNQSIDEHLEKIADAIMRVVEWRKEGIKEVIG